MSEILTNDDFRFLSNLAKKVYRKSCLLKTIEREDFVQNCALSALQNLHKLPSFTDHKAFISSVVHYKAKDYWNYEDISKSHKKNEWYMSNFSRTLTDSSIEENYSFDAFSAVEDKINNDDVLKLINKALKPIEFLTFNTICKTGNCSKAAKELGVSREAVRLRLQAIKQKIEGLELL